MAAWLMLALQATAVDGAAAIDHDIADRATRIPAIVPQCRSGGAEIVVCGRRAEPELPPEEMRRLYADAPVRAEIGLGGAATGRLFLDQAQIAPGQVSQRIMIGVKVGF